MYPLCNKTSIGLPNNFSKSAFLKKKRNLMKSKSKRLEIKEKHSAMTMSS